jgi:hypothetical protein
MNMNQLPYLSKPWQKSPENSGKYLWGLSMELGNIVAKNHGSNVDEVSHPRLLTITYGSWHTAGSHQPVVNGAPSKLTDPIWPSQAKNFLHLPCGRRRTDISTLLSPVETGGLYFQCSVPFWGFLESYLKSALWVYINKFTLKLT